MLVALGSAVTSPADLSLASPSTTAPAAKPVSSVQNDQEELNVVMARYDRWNRRNRDCVLIVAALMLCGALCAYWACSVYRNPVLWFFAGFFLNVVAFGIILSSYRRHRHKRRYRRVISYWYVSR